MVDSRGLDEEGCFMSPAGSERNQMNLWRFQDDRRFVSGLSAEGKMIYDRLHQEIEELRREVQSLRNQLGR